MENSSNTSTSNFTKSIKELFTHKSEAQKNLSEDPKVACEMVLKLLIAYEEIDQANKKKPSSDPIKKKFTLFGGGKDAKNPQELTLAKVDMSFLFCLLNLTLGEFYSSYQSFHHQFDSKNTSQIEEKEFQAMLDFLCRRENMGTAKVRKSFEICSPEDFKMYNKIALLNPAPNDQLEEFLKKGMFTVLSVKEAKANSIGTRSHIHYLRFFPITLSYFGEFIKKRVHIRLANMELICGLNSKKQRVTNRTSSLLDKLEHLGCKYEGDDYPTLVSFSSLEKALILLRNSYSATFGPDQLQLILKELLVKCRVKDGAEREERSIRLNYKLLRWIAYRICLHCSLYALMKETKDNSSVPRYAILEEYTIWAAAFAQDIFNEDTIERKFYKFARKRFEKQRLSDLDDHETKKLIMSVLQGFLRKLFPHISEQSIQKIYETFSQKEKLDNHSEIAEKLSKAIYELIIQVADQKLVDLIGSVYGSLKNSANRVEKQHTNKKAFAHKNEPFSSQTTMNDPQPDRQTAEEQNLNTPAPLKTRESSKKSRRRASLFAALELLPKLDEQEGELAEGGRDSKKSVHSLVDTERSILESLAPDEKIDLIEEPSIKRKSSNISSSLIDPPLRKSSSLAEPSIPEQKSKFSLFAQAETGTTQKKSLHYRTQSGPRIDLTRVAGQSDSGKLFVRTSSLAKRIQQAAAMTEEEEETRNKATGRNTDVVKSLLIAQTFLVKYAKKQENLPKQPRHESGNSSPSSGHNSSPKHGAYQNSPVLKSRFKPQDSFERSPSRRNTNQSWKPRSSNEEEQEDGVDAFLSKLDESPKRFVKNKASESKFKSSQLKALRVATEIDKLTHVPLVSTASTIKTPEAGDGINILVDEKNESLLWDLSEAESEASARTFNEEGQIKEESFTQKGRTSKKVIKRKKKEKFTQIIKGYKMKESDQIQFTRSSEVRAGRENYCGTGNNCVIF